MDPSEGVPSSFLNLGTPSEQQPEETKNPPADSEKTNTVGQEALRTSTQSRRASSYSGDTDPHKFLSLRKKKTFSSDGSPINLPPLANVPSFNEKVPSLASPQKDSRMEEHWRKVLQDTLRHEEKLSPSAIMASKDDAKVIYKFLHEESKGLFKRKQHFYPILNEGGKLQWINMEKGTTIDVLDNPVKCSQIVQTIHYIINRLNSLLDQHIWDISRDISYISLSSIKYLFIQKPDPINWANLIGTFVENPTVQQLLIRVPQLREDIIRTMIRTYQEPITADARQMLLFLLKSELARSQCMKILSGYQKSKIPTILAMLPANNPMENISVEDVDMALELLQMDAVKNSCDFNDKCVKLSDVFKNPEAIYLVDGSHVYSYDEIFKRYYQFIKDYLSDIAALEETTFATFIQTYDKLSPGRKEAALASFANHDYPLCIITTFRKINTGITNLKEGLPSIIREISKRCGSFVESERSANLIAEIKEYTTLPIQWEKLSEALNELSIYLSYQ